MFLFIVKLGMAAYILYYAVGLFLGVFDALVFWVQALDIACPHCHSVLKRLCYKCPDCNRVYENLRPNLAHPFYLRCACGRKLATMRLFGRSRYLAFCPQCRGVVGNNGGESQIVAFPIVGGPSAGKTAFLTAALIELRSSIPLRRKWKYTVPFSEDARFMTRALESFRNGVKPNKTNDRVPTALCLDYRGKGLEESKRLCLYDPSGETFVKDWAMLQKQKYYNFMRGLVVAIDPLALPNLPRQYKTALSARANDLGACPADQDACIERLLNRLTPSDDPTEDETSLRAKKELPCAIVLTKADAFDLDRYIGEEGVRRFRERYPRFGYDDAMDNICKFYLEQWGGANILYKLEEEFGSVRCFSASALAVDQRGAFDPKRVDKPFEWLLKEAGVDGRFNKQGILIILIIILFPVCCSFLWGIFKIIQSI